MRLTEDHWLTLAVICILVVSILAGNAQYRSAEKHKAEQDEFAAWCESTEGHVIKRPGGFLSPRYNDCLWPPQ